VASQSKTTEAINNVNFTYYIR